MVFERKYSYSGRNFNVPAATVGKVFEELEEEHGAVTDDNFLDYSRPEGSPTHKLFEWNDAEAAERYRLQQARSVINAVRIEVVLPESQTPVKIAAVMNVSDTNRDGSARYINAEYALSNLRSRKAILKRAEAEMRTFRYKYSTLKELSKVMSAIDDVLGREGESS